MKILYISDYLYFGGAEMQNRREASAMASLGHSVLVLTFDNIIENPPIDNYNFKNLVLGKNTKLNKLIPNHFNVNKIKRIIKTFKPDIIRINNVNNNTPTVLKSVKGYRVIQTLRDYGSVCPNGYSIYLDSLEKCRGHCSKTKCIRCLEQKYSWIKSRWKYYCFIHNLKMIKAIINTIVCPSECLNIYANNIGLNSVCINNPFDFSLINQLNNHKEIDSKRKVFFYYGLIGFHKGIKQLMESFSSFVATHNNVELHLVGHVDDSFEQEFYSLLSVYNNKIKYLGVMNYCKVLDYINNHVYCVVVPSLWMENYPNTILESQCLKKIVIASDRGGMVDMIGNRSFIFDVLNKDDIIKKLEFALNLSKDEHDMFVNQKYNYVYSNNTIDTYIKNIEKLFVAINNR